jgi:hypothetical protein
MDTVIPPSVRPVVRSAYAVWGVSRIQLILSIPTLESQGDVRDSWGLRRRLGGSARPHRFSLLCVLPRSRVRAGLLARTVYGPGALALAIHGSNPRWGWR